jgi:signal transduction histidine kinase/ActR/RegA family two-component response regulator
VVQVVEIFASHAAIAIANAATAAALRDAAVRERLINLVRQAPRGLGTGRPLIERILAELGAALEADACALVAQESTGQALAHHLMAIWPPNAFDDIRWDQLDLSHTHDEQISADGYNISIAVPDRGEAPAWLIARAGWPERFWRRAERELMRFAADQIALILANERLISAEQRSRALSATLAQLATACNAMIDQESVLDFILEQLSHFVSYDSAGVFIFQDGQYARLVAGRGYRFNHDVTVVLAAGPGSPSWMLQHNYRATSIPDVRAVSDWQDVPDSKIIRAWIGAPLMVGKRAIGVLTIDKWTPNAFSSADVQVAQMFGDHVAVAINNARLLRDAQTRASQIQVLHQLSSGLSALSDVQLLLDEVAGLLHNAFGYYQVVVGLIEGDQIIMRSARGMVNDVAGFGAHQRYSTSCGLTGWVARHGETLLVNDVSQDPRYGQAPPLSDTRSELVVAIRQGEAILGIIDIQGSISGEFNQSDVHLAESLAGQVAVALANIRRYEELRRTQEQLLHSERLRALGELASGVAHDFNNLLSSILGHAQLMLDSTDDPGISEGLRIIEGAAHDGAATVRRLQSFAQTNRSLPDEEVRLDEIVTESLAITRPRWRDSIQSRGAHLRIVRSLGNLPPMVGDGPALRDLVTNLILNAIDAMPDGGELRLRTTLLAGASELAVIEIADTGVGMTAEVRQRIFDPFFSTKGPDGTGMGLAMAYGVVQRHNGTISVESTPGQGSVFQVRLPVRRLAPAAPRAHADEPPGRPLRILAVEDDDAVRRVLAQILRRAGHAVTEAATGFSAMSLLEAGHYDLLCTDLGMPGMSGWDVVARARALRPNLMTILITGWGEQITPEEAYGRGVDAVVAKPFDAVRLRETIADLQLRPVADDEPGSSPQARF